MTRTQRFLLVGGHPALDFVNTVAWRLSDDPQERMVTFEGLVEWCRQSALIDATLARDLVTRGQRRPADATATLAEAHALREIGYRLVVSVMQGENPAARDVRRFNQILARAPARLQPGASGFDYRSRNDGAPSSLVDRVVRVFAEFLTGDSVHRVRQCDDDRGCGWLFVNRSRSKPRRWCSMKECGNRAKVARHRSARKPG